MEYGGGRDLRGKVRSHGTERSGEAGGGRGVGWGGGSQGRKQINTSRGNKVEKVI